MAGEIFISYRRADEAWARLLHAQLRAEGVEAWYDAQVGAGQDWRVATAKALEASQIFVLLFSSNAAQSSEIAKELAAATLEKKLIIPVRLENIAPKGAFLYELASRNWVNAFENTEAKLAELAKGLAHLVRTGARDESVLRFDRSDGGEIPGPPQKRLGKPVLISATVIAVIAASTIAAWLLWPAKHWTVESSRPFISTLALEDFPAFSPNGAMLAYSSGPEGGKRQIYVRNLTAGEGIKIAGDAYDDISPTWSSDGARLAYVAIKPGEPCRIMVATFPAGGAREAGRCDHAESSSVTWQPGTPFVYSVERGGLKGDTIFRLNLDAGVREVIVAKTALRDTITGLHCSPDGKWLAYLIGSQEIIVRDLATGREKTLGNVSEQGSWNTSLAWAEDSGTVLTGTNGRVGGSEINAHPISGGTPYSVYATAAKIGNFATGGGLLALETDISRGSLARAGAAPATQPDIIDPANGLTWSPSFAPDGTLAFLSNRSGTNAIWLMKPGAAPIMLFDGGLSAMVRVQFSPDGTRLAVASETTKNVTVKIMTRDGANLASFDMPSRGLGLPSWMPDGKAVLVFDRHSLRTTRIPLDNVAQHSPYAPRHWVGIIVRKDGTFATRADRPGIWRIDGGIKQINSTYPGYYDAPLAFRGDDVLVPEYDPGSTPRILAQPVAGGPSRAIAYAPGAVNQNGFQSDFAVNPTTGEIVYTAQVSRDSNIDLLTLARTRR
ncbi:MAG TPA: TIR domain-containing protein [Rhizomicrobium sp.]|nr:TIR domain-containing protein [Rhizomicrobium sp.]